MGISSSSSHISVGSRNGTVQSASRVVSPPTMVVPGMPIKTQSVQTVPVQTVPAPVATTTGARFTTKPGPIMATSGVSNPGGQQTVRDHRAMGLSPGTTTDPAQTRIRTNAAMGVGAMPAIRQRLLDQGQSLQTWSANRQLAFDQFHHQNATRMGDFQRDRNDRWSQIQSHGGDLVRMARERGADWQNFRRDLWNFRVDRSNEIRDGVRHGCDGLFTFDWWCQQRGRNFLLGSHSPWWWWNHCSWNTAAAFCGYGWGAPIYYDYGANVLVGDDVYVDGQDSGPSTAYAQQATELANPPAAEEQPVPPQADEQTPEWQTFGVFALTQEESGSAILFLELAMNKDGRISGALTNVLTNDAEMVRGSIDRATQKAAWHVGDKTNTVYETGVANLTLDVAPVLIHLGPQVTQTWLLVRMSSPDQSTMPSTPAAAPQR